MNYILFDPENRESLMPIAALRPISSIRVGALTIQEKWEKHLNAKCSLSVPEYLQQKFPGKLEEDNLFINASVLPSIDLVDEIQKLKFSECLLYKDEIIALRGKKRSDEYQAKEWASEITRINNTWDIISCLKQELLADLSHITDGFSSISSTTHATVMDNENVFVGEDVKIGACILNSSSGKIVIDDGAEIMDGAILKGPIYIGKHTVIKMGAKLYGPIATGEECRVGGEVSDSIFQGFCNKGHDGFLGHSYLGEWCNLGADTNTSNLKNTYDKVRLWNYATKRFDKTGMQFLGLIMGDHSKTGINTMLNTGTVIGTACNVYGAGFPRNFVPDFTQGSTIKMSTFCLMNANKMARAMMERRNIVFTSLDEQIMKSIFDKTQPFRKF